MTGLTMSRDRLLSTSRTPPSTRVIGSDIFYVDTCGSANRAGNMWISPGYRYTSTGRVISREKIRFTAITPDDLADRLDQLVANNDVHSVTAWEHP